MEEYYVFFQSVWKCEKQEVGHFCDHIVEYKVNMKGMEWSMVICVMDCICVGKYLAAGKLVIEHGDNCPNL